MPGYESFALIQGVGILVVVILVFKGIANRGVIHLALSKFEINPEDESQIIIEGRKTGLMQWLLVKLKLGNIYRIRIKKDQVDYSADSAAGKEMILIPITKVSSTSCGYRKPIELLLLGAVLAVFGLVMLFQSLGAAIALLLCAAVFFALYVYMKNFFISIETTGSRRIGFSFKRSFIENVAVDVEQIEEAINLINSLAIKEGK